MKRLKKIICIIPARKGSKRIKNKNIINFFGKPLISYSIENALKSNIFEKVIVSTDSQKISNISKKYGADVPFLRPKKLSGNNIIVKDVLIHCLNKLKNIKKYEYFCCLYPTAPLITPKDLKLSYKKLTQQKASALISISKYNNHPLRSLLINNKNYLSFKFKKFQRKNSQDLQPLFHDAGAFYFYKIDDFLRKKKSLIPTKTIPYRLKTFKAVDIDDYEDLNLAKLIYKK